MDPQRLSTKSLVVEQLSLLPARKACPEPDIDYLMALPNVRRALRYSISLADLEPKQVYDPMEIDKATWSRIENGQQAFPIDRYKEFRAIVQNDALLLWLNHDNGYDVRQMVRIKSDVERENEQLKAQIAEMQREREAVAKFMREIGR